MRGVETSERSAAVTNGSNRANDVVTLRELRELRGLTLRVVERETGIARGRISEIETGKRLPSPWEIVTLAGLYDVDPRRFAQRIEHVIERQYVGTTKRRDE